jgi:sugar phosphate isomerase/epimerase
MKLADEGSLEAVRTSGLHVTNCVPLVPSILPNAVVEGPGDVEERIESMCASMTRLAALEPDCVLCLTGPGSDDDRQTIVDGLRRVAAAAADAGVPLGLEPIHASQREQLSIVTTIPEALELLDEAGLPHVGIMVDLWHVGDTPEVERHLAENVGRITGVHVAERLPGRDDRGLPGARCVELMRVLHDGGWRGAWDVEIFGDPERQDSLWSLPVDEAARRAHAAAVAAAP